MSVFDVTAFNIWLRDVAIDAVHHDGVYGYGDITVDETGICVTKKPEDFPQHDWDWADVVEDAYGITLLSWHGNYYRFSDVEREINNYAVWGWYSEAEKRAVYGIFDFIREGWYWNAAMRVPLYLRIDANAQFDMVLGGIAQVITQFTCVCDAVEYHIAVDDDSIGTYSIGDLINDVGYIDLEFDWENDSDIVDVWEEDVVPELVDEDPISVIDLTLDD